MKKAYYIVIELGGPAVGWVGGTCLLSQILFGMHTKDPISFITIKESTGLKNFCSFFAILSVNVIESTFNYLDGQNHRRFSSTFPVWMWKAHATIFYSVPRIVLTQNRCSQII